MRARGGLATVGVAAALTLAACTEDKQTRIGDAAIIEKLNLEETEDGFAIDGDPFCGVADRFFNTADEVEAAEEADKIGLVVASRQSNVGIQGLAPFAGDCREKAKKKLNKLDPPEA